MKGQLNCLAIGSEKFPKFSFQGRRTMFTLGGGMGLHRQDLNFKLTTEKGELSPNHKPHLPVSLTFHLSAF